MEKHNKKRCSVIAVLSVVTLVGVGLGLSLFIHYQQRNKHPHLQNQPSTYPTVAITSTTAPTQATEPIHEHSYTTETKVATCTEAGYTLHSCACGDTYRSDEVKAKGHQYGAAKEKEATCTAKGGLVKTCDICEHKNIENAISALGHEWSSWETTIEATTSAAGEKTRTCNRCHKTEKKTIAKLKESSHQHSYTKTVVEATCVKEGYTRYTCACGKSYDTDKTPLRSHLYGDWETVKKPTATSTGKKEAICQRCGKVTSKSIPKLSDEDIELYKKYIDPKIEIMRRASDGAVHYSYKDVSVSDVRGWGDPPYLRVTSSGGINVIYAKKDGTKVEWTVEPYEGYVRWMVIQKNGSYTVSLIGDFND